MKNKYFSHDQGVMFYDIPISDQAYLLDNFQLMINMLTDQLEKNPDAVHRHWLDCLEKRYKNICERVELER